MYISIGCINIFLKFCWLKYELLKRKLRQKEQNILVECTDVIITQKYTELKKINDFNMSISIIFFLLLLLVSTKSHSRKTIIL